MGRQGPEGAPGRRPLPTNHGTLVSEVMSRNFATVNPSTTLDQAARLMAEENVNFLSVLRDGAVGGIVSDTDIMVRVFTKGQDPQSITVEDVVSEPALCCRMDMLFDDVQELMLKQKIRRAAVTDEEDRPVGIVLFEGAL